ncbi:dihydrolipoamide acetyltransferase family protein [Lacisediminihabitans profunda]|uniref:Dihydrolipoamide acetyltransferase component of pyruvate dehydrogenase complex n=1 Tax=Lacisediminihabitans profunda TaxID=2594790 RepID=A0A5C8UU84_9MICO|nr:dihydrolipoamide acetyltransferase family protein [Lacisediminihabitans profunda]TXN31510.1 2-oxo acid dehydrogenase subunit E2 [Lacisediminihabitans profunda]
MSELRDFRLPDLGEGLTESEIVAWRVAVGDTVELNQIIAEVETAKALVELPSPFAGVIGALYAEPGQVVQVGAPLVGFEAEESAEVPAQDAEARSQAPDAAAPVQREAVLVGYGPKIDGGSRPRRKARSAGWLERPDTAHDSRSHRPAPPLRKLASDLGVDLDAVTGSGTGGLITRDDVRRHATAPPATAARETRTPIQGVRKLTAQAMVASAFTAPHATEFLTIDVTPSMELRERLKTSSAFRGERLTMLTVVAKAVCLAAARTPVVNSRWDEKADEIVQFGYINLGIAAATPRGLMVPNVKDAQGLDLLSLARALTALVERAREGKSTPAELGGGTISITNIGVFGIDAGTPILNPGEAAILAMGAVRRAPWEYHDAVALRHVMTLSLSFDHRLVDGSEASRFLADVGTILSDPGMLLTMV